MYAIRVHAPGDVTALRYEEVATPEPAAGEVLIKIAAAGVNFIDVYHRTGLYPLPAPFTPGMEAAGTVAALGAGVTELAVGDRVAYASHLGAYAEYAVVPASKLVPVPAGIELAHAATLLQAMTAHYLSHSSYPIQPGDRVLVHAAAGGTGQLLVQMAKLRGAEVFGTVSTAEKAELARAAGVDHVIRYTEQDFATEIARITDGAGVHAVYDSVGKTTFEQSLNSLRPRGYMVLFGQSSGPVPPFDPAILNAKGSLFLTRPSLFHYAAERSELLQRAGDVFRWVADGQLTLRIDRSYPLREAAAAHGQLEGRGTTGKLLLLPE